MNRVGSLLVVLTAAVFLNGNVARHDCRPTPVEQQAADHRPEAPPQVCAAHGALETAWGGRVEGALSLTDRLTAGGFAAPLDVSPSRFAPRWRARLTVHGAPIPASPARHAPLLV